MFTFMGKTLDNLTEEEEALLFRYIQQYPPPWHIAISPEFIKLECRLREKYFIIRPRRMSKEIITEQILRAQRFNTDYTPQPPRWRKIFAGIINWIMTGKVH